MALIKCTECGKEISDKATSCPNCGCPVKQKIKCTECGKEISDKVSACPNCGCPTKDITTYKKTNSVGFCKVWLIICIITCFLICIINLFNTFNIQVSMLKIGNITINFMGVMSFLLGMAYINLLKNLNKQSFYLLAFINLIIFLFNVCYIGMAIPIIYIICVILNLTITSLCVKGKLTKDKVNIKDNIPILIIGIIGVIFILISTSFNSSNSIIGTYIQDGGVGTTLIIEKDNNCSMVVSKQDDKFPSTISNCRWSISDNQITINFTMSVSSAYVSDYTRDATLSGTFYGDYIEMDAGAIYYKK